MPNKQINNFIALHKTTHLIFLSLTLFIIKNTNMCMRQKYVNTWHHTPRWIHRIQFPGMGEPYLDMTKYFETVCFSVAGWSWAASWDNLGLLGIWFMIVSFFHWCSKYNLEDTNKIHVGLKSLMGALRYILSREELGVWFLLSLG